MTGPTLFSMVNLATGQISALQTDILAEHRAMRELIARYALGGPMSGNSYEFEKEAAALLARIEGA